MHETRDCSVCGSSHEDDGEALECVAHDWLARGIAIKDQKEKIQGLEARVKELEGKLDAVSDIIWDLALPFMDDVDHTIDYHADSLPIVYRKLAEAHTKVLDVVNWRPDVG